MTFKRNWSILVALFVILSLFLVACVRPLPGDNESIPTAAPPETYPGPAAPESESSPAEESYPVNEEDQDGSVDLLQPDGDGEAELEDYPGVDAAASEGETTAGEAAENVTAESEATAGEAVESEAAESEETQGESTADETAGGTPEGEATADAEGSEPIESGRTHTVAAGQTLYSIGVQYGLSWVTLAEANGITNPDSLYIGQVLTIPDVSAAESSETAAAEETAVAAEESDSAPDTTEPPAEAVTYIVQSGDNLYQISLRFGVSMMDIARANDLANFDQIYAGQELTIPAAEAAEETAQSSAEVITHLVQEGETVFSIAFENGIAWTKLVEANEIVSPYTLEVGQSLIIPAGN